MKRTVVSLVVVFLALVAGFGVGRWSSRSENWGSAAFVDAIEQAGMAAMSLELMDTERMSTLEQLQIIQLEGGIKKAHTLIEHAPRLEFPLPNTVELAARAQLYTESHESLHDLSEVAEEVSRHLVSLSDRAVLELGSDTLGQP
jgi:hypothetical protein